MKSTPDGTIFSSLFQSLVLLDYTVRINWRINSISDSYEILWWPNCDL